MPRITNLAIPPEEGIESTIKTWDDFLQKGNLNRQESLKRLIKDLTNTSVNATTSGSYWSIYKKVLSNLTTSSASAPVERKLRLRSS